MSEQRIAGATRPLTQLLTFVRKEAVTLLRQPRLLLVLVIGPFGILLLFAVGYDQQQVVLRTAFVGPEESIYAESIGEITDELDEYVSDAGYGTDVLDARQRLETGDIDLIVIFPPDPAESVMNGEQAMISVIHDKLDPIQQTAVEVSAQVAVLELNASILARVAGTAQTSLTPYADSVEVASAVVRDIEIAIGRGDDAEVERLTDRLDEATRDMRSAVSATEQLVAGLGGEVNEGQREQLDQVVDAIDDLQQRSDALRTGADRATAEDARLLADGLDQIDERADTVLTIDPAIVTRPFAADAASLLRERVRVIDFFAPAAVALLLQHMMITFGSISLVRDRQSGLFETLRVGPIGAGRVLLGKFVAFLLVGGIVATLLMVAVTGFLGVPARGDAGWIVVATLGVLAGSAALGFSLSMLATTDSQAVQYAMLTLLAGMFFAGLLLDLDTIRYPVKFISWLLPMTYGVRSLRDVMLRGATPSSMDLIAMAGLFTAYGLAAWSLLRHRLKVG